MVLMMKPKVGLTLFTSSFMIFLTIVVFPALSSPLCIVSSGPNGHLVHLQHQDSHLLVLQTSFTEYRQHIRRLVPEVGIGRETGRVEKEIRSRQKSRGRIRHTSISDTDSMRCMWLTTL